MAPQATSTVPIMEKPKTLRVVVVVVFVDAMRLGAWLRSGEGIGWLAAGTIPNSLYRVPLLDLFIACALCCCSFLCVVHVLVLFCTVGAL